MKLLSFIFILAVLITNAKPSFASTTNNVKASSSSGNGGNSSVKVDIKNNVNTGSSTNSVNGTTTTNVDIDQTGSGTSEVTINGKTWKQEGPGSITVSESSSSSGLTPTIQSPTPSIANEKDSTQNEGFFDRLFASIKSFFSKIF